jgi:hypothetical protein
LLPAQQMLAMGNTNFSTPPILAGDTFYLCCLNRYQSCLRQPQMRHRR